ncbi:hypothetical protein AVEN_102201-1 [Araneus ventricosus]|uniref:Uncharacterized protein n=1 Tax=Araneus ventricosus TaxID=182803 RepID=A0A4Y2LBF6_ARAVE|nr:hypothetical protein AVEN_102201-1 [Araneus ventricosus]
MACQFKWSDGYLSSLDIQPSNPRHSTDLKSIHYQLFSVPAFSDFLDEARTPNLLPSHTYPLQLVLIHGLEVQMERWISELVECPAFFSTPLQF